MTIGTGCRAIGFLGVALAFAACGNGTVKTSTTSGGTSTGAVGGGSSGTAGTGTGGHASGGSTGGGSTGGGFSDCRDGGFDCSPFGELCDPTTGKCVQCFATSDCAGAASGAICDTSTNDCVECLTPADCPYITPGCSNDSCGFCVQNSDCPPNDVCDGGTCYCSGNAGCGGNAPACLGVDAGGGFCGCSASSQCSSGDICDTTTLVLNGVCVAPCTSDAGACAPGSLTPYCDASSGLCVPCLTNAQCIAADAGTICLPGVGCASCQTDSDCKDPATPHCLFGSCVQCETAADCPANAPGCNFVTNSCGSCTLNSDCASGEGCLNSACAPICESGPVPDGGCASCTVDSDCPSGTCDTSSGVCQ